METSLSIRSPDTEICDKPSGEIGRDYEGDLLERYITYTGIMGFRKAAYDQFLEKMWTMIHDTKIPMQDGTIIGFEDAFYQQPYYEVGINKSRLMPSMARGKESYKLTLSTNMTMTYLDGTVKKTSREVYIGRIPLMLGSKNCYLHGMTDVELFEAGEDPYDPLGYFICGKGKEKTLPLKEMLRTNKILLFPTKDNVECRMTCFTSKGTQIVSVYWNAKGAFKIGLSGWMKNSKTNRSNSVGVFQMFRLLGLKRIEDIIGIFSMFVNPKNKSKVMAALEVSIDKLRRVADDEEYILKRIINSLSVKRAQQDRIDKDKRRSNARKNESAEEKKMNIQIAARENYNIAMKRDLFAHIEVEDPKSVNLMKIYLLSIMIVRLVEYKVGVRKLDDRDSWSNKRAITDGGLMLQLFRYTWNSMIAAAKSSLDSSTRAPTIETVHTLIKGDKIEKEISSSFDGVLWKNSKNSGTMNVVQELKRESMVASIAHLTLLDVKTSRKDKQITIRTVHDTQIGLVDVVETPDGANTGIIKHLAVSASISLDHHEYKIREMIHPFISYQVSLSQSTKLVINGKFLGFVDGPGVAAEMRRMRRDRVFGEQDQFEIVYEPSDDILYIYSDEGRLYRPLLVVNPKTQQLVIDEIDGWNMSWYDLLEKGAIDYISAWEQEYTDIAFRFSDIRNPPPLRPNDNAEVTNEQIKRRIFTHCELDPAAQLGFAASTIPMPEHNQSPRNVFQCTDIHTLVMVPNGSVMIKDLKDGDEVLTVEPFSREVSVTKIKNHFIKPSDRRVLKIMIAGREIIVTEDHPFLSLHQWVEAKDLDIGDYILIYDTSIYGQPLYVDIKSITEEKDCMVADFETESENHSFIANGFVVHNCGMIKQALGIFHANYQNRMDLSMKVLNSPNRPIFEPGMNQLIGLNQAPSGQMVNVAISTYTGWTQEDAFIFSQGAVDRGLFRYTYYKTYSASCDNKVYRQEFGLPPARDGVTNEIYKNIDKNGMPIIGAYVRQGECIIGRVKYDETGRKLDDSIYLDLGDEGRVDTVIRDPNWDRQDTVTVKLRWVRTPMKADKFAPRYAQKGTIGVIYSDEDMPFSGNPGAAPRPDIIINSHCFTADTPVLMKNGLSKRLIDTKYNGGSKVWSFDKSKMEFVTSESIGYGSNGIKEIVEVTFSDGRKIRCTPDHKFPVVDLGKDRGFKDVPISEATSDMVVFAGFDGVLDNPTTEERDIEVAWSLVTENFNFNMKTNEDREKSLAFARLLGMILTDGCLCETKSGSVVGNIVTGSNIDVDAVLDDIELLTNKRPAIFHNVSEMGSTMVVRMPIDLSRSAASLKGMTVGRRTQQEQRLPWFLFEDNCPKSVIREFLGGLFGGDGWSPYLRTNKQDGQGTVTFCDPAISLSASEEHYEGLIEKMTSIGKLLERVGVPGARVDKPKEYSEGMFTCTLQLPRGTEFGDKVGFRYCIQKMCRQAAYQSYMRYLSEVKRQNDTIVRRTSEIFDNREVGNSLKRALDKAREELFLTEKPLNEYYSNATLDQIKNRRRKDRFKELHKWDYTYIEDAEKYLRKIGAYHWFRGEAEGIKADYITEQNATGVSAFYLRIHDIRSVGKEEVYDLGIHKTRMLVVMGIGAHNSLPSRMTLSYLMEILSSKAAVIEGERINATAFRSFDMKHFEEILHTNGFQKKGFESLYSGITGELMQTTVYTGPAYFQSLRHHVLDKYQMRQRGAIKPGSHLPTGQKKARGIRFGEMERDSAISHGAAKFLQERLMTASSGFETVFCMTCGQIAIVNSLEKQITCKKCGDRGVFGRCEIPMTFRLLVHYLNGMGLTLSLKMAYKKDLSVARINQIRRGKGRNLVNLEEIGAGEMGEEINIDEVGEEDEGPELGDEDFDRVDRV